MQSHLQRDRKRKPHRGAENLRRRQQAEGRKARYSRFVLALDRRRVVTGLGVGLLLVPLASRGQPARRAHRVGLLHSETAQAIPQRLQALREGLRDFGYIEGINLSIEYKWAEGDSGRLFGLASELVQAGVEVIVTTATEAVLAAKRATSVVPIVFATVGDAVATGVVASLARPGGNATGSTFFSPELMAKRLEIAKRIIPGLERVSVLLNPDSTLDAPILDAMQRTARLLRLSVQRFDVRESGRLGDAFAAMTQQGMQAVVVHDHPRFIASRQVIAQLSLRNSVPAIGYDELADAGALVGYGANFTELWRRAAYFVDKILRGTRPEELPVEQVARFDFIVNLRTARQLQIRIPDSVLVMADRLIQ